ncbi:prepilin-type N-terminal cleavage/methylation domain-containing protein [bacterium]|nr:prepilin-type N-terminal cleavage/methylation domain-containing protein [bacterium]
MRRQHRDRSAAKAFTLLEMLLVVAVLVGVAAVGYSSFLGFNDSQRMVRVGDDLRGLITGLRVQAMEDQRAYLLAYRPETGDYVIRTNVPDAIDRETREPIIGPIRSDGPYLVGAHRLEDDMRFLRLDLPIDPTSASSQTDLVQNGFIAVSFGPDGTADDFSIGIVDRDGFAVIAQVAGRTGRVTLQGPMALSSGQSGQTPGGIPR